MTRFYLIRHGEKASPPALITARADGIELTAKGQQQALAIAEKLAGERITAIYASPMRRAQQTAAPLAEASGLPVGILEGIHEFDFGEWTNHTLEELSEDPLWKPFNTFRSSTRAGGAESMLEVQSRFVGAMMRLRNQHPDTGVALFSHGDPIRAAVMYFAGTPLDLWHRIEISIASISIIEMDTNWAVIRSVNLVPTL